jgi:Protein of unknown function (DUF2950)
MAAVSRAEHTAGSEAACVVVEEVAGMGDLEAAGMVVAAVTGNWICGGKQFSSARRLKMEVNRTMMPIRDSVQKVRWWTLVRFTPVALFALWTFGFTWILLAEPPGQSTFSSAAEASRALFRAAQAGDERALLKIFGPDGKEIVSSGEAVEDKNGIERFVKKYQEMNRLVEEPDGTIRLYIGAENWPMPIPLVNKSGAWYFDTEAGREEILFRRIGRNEIAVIRVLQELVDAQKEYYSEPRDNAFKQYAQKFVSDQDKHNGLYWKTSNGETESPIGPLVAYASSEGYPKDPNFGPGPFQGYYYGLLTRQGKNASGGAKNYIVNGNMTRGFAFLAYPAEYGASGIMSFIVDQDGIVYQKDLGPNTVELAKTLREYNPDKTWVKVE